MTLSYDDIFSNYLGYITDYKIASLNTNTAYDMMVEWLNKAYKKPYVRSLFSQSKIDNEVMTLTFTMKYPGDEDADLDLISDILSKGMVIEWLHPQVENIELTAQMVGGKEEKYYSQSAHLEKLQDLLFRIRTEQRSMIGERNGITNSYLGES